MLVKPYVFFRSGHDINNAPGDIVTFRSPSDTEAEDNGKVMHVVEESDNQLIRCLEVIKSIHSCKFGMTNSNDANIVGFFTEIKSTVLVNALCLLLFSYFRVLIVLGDQFRKVL